MPSARVMATDRALPPLPTDYAARMPAFAEAAELELVALVLVSGFRSIARQAEILQRKLERGIPWEEILRQNAYPGFSEHHTGRAVDIATPEHPRLEETFGNTPEFAWLNEHAADFGFRLSYPRGNPHGIAFEPWHWCWQVDAL